MIAKAATLSMIRTVDVCSRKTRLSRLKYGIRLLTITMTNDTHEKGIDGTEIRYLRTYQKEQDNDLIA